MSGLEQLEGAVGVVTGGASGIGFAMAQRLAAEGARVVIADIEPGATAAAVGRLEAEGVTCLGVPTDVSDAASVERLLGETVARFGKVNVLCNNAGVQRCAPTWELTPEEWKWVLDVNLWGVIHGIRAFVPRMLEQGDPCHVVNTASMGGLIAGPTMSAYCAAKHAVVAISECLSLELTGTNVGVSVLCPGFVKTRLGDSDRNKPEGIDQGLTSEGVEQRRAIGAGASALVDAGIDPAHVADHVIAAIRARRLHILTHPEMLGALRKRLERILKAAERPSPA
jgi:NAD(P)-dependent dehydrogenase (short-subunit alcohol dehydrogenase family)